MTKPNDRLRKIRNSLKISQREFAKRISLSQSMVADMEMGHFPIKERYLKLICSEFNVSMDFLKNGTGEIFSPKPPDLRFEYLKDIFVQFDTELQDVILDHCRQLLKVHKK